MFIKTKNYDKCIQKVRIDIGILVGEFDGPSRPLDRTKPSQ